jgi:hypothetical protein
MEHETGEQAWDDEERDELRPANAEGREVADDLDDDDEADDRSQAAADEELDTND